MFDNAIGQRLVGDVRCLRARCRFRICPPARRLASQLVSLAKTIAAVRFRAKAAGRSGNVSALREGTTAGASAASIPTDETVCNLAPSTCLATHDIDLPYTGKVSLLRSAM